MIITDFYQTMCAWGWESTASEKVIGMGIRGGQVETIMKTRLYNFDPLKPHFFFSKTGVYRGIHYYSAKI